MTLEEIAAHLGVSHQRVMRLEARALRKLRRALLSSAAEHDDDVDALRRLVAADTIAADREATSTNARRRARYRAKKVRSA